MLSGLMNVGKTALNAAQAWISVTGSNIANADTEGYTRRYVDQRDAGTLVAKPGGEGLGLMRSRYCDISTLFLKAPMCASPPILPAGKSRKTSWGRWKVFSTNPIERA